MKRQKIFSKINSRNLIKPNYATFAQILEKVTTNIEEDDGLKIIQEDKLSSFSEKEDLFQTNMKFESPPDTLINVL